MLFLLAEMHKGQCFLVPDGFAHFLEDALGDGRVEQGLAASDGFKRPHQGLAVDLFQDVA